MLIIKQTKAYKKSLKRIFASGRGNIRGELRRLINSLSLDEKLDSKYQDHGLNGVYQNYRECHIKSDLLLIYQIDEKILLLVNIGSHSELFE